MKKLMITSGIFYSFFTVISIIFLFNNFTKSAETNFTFRIIATVMMLYISTYPLVIATSEIINPPVVGKVFLYIAYVIFAGSVLFFSFKVFGDKTFMNNANLTDEAFKNSQKNLTSALWIIMLVSAIAFIPILSVKMGRLWPDWTFFLLVPFSPLIAGLAITGIGLLFIYWFFKGMGSSSSETSSDSYSSDYSYSDSEDDTSEETQERNGILRSPGENYYDGNGILRSPGENYYDGNGVLRSPDENYYDGGN